MNTTGVVVAQSFVTEEFFADVFTRKFGVVRGYIGKYNWVDPEGITAAAWARAWEARHQFRGNDERAFVSWVITIAVNKAKQAANQERRRGRWEEQHRLAMEALVWHIRQLDINVELDLNKILDRMDPVKRQQLVDRYFFGEKDMSITATARRLRDWRARSAAREIASDMGLCSIQGYGLGKLAKSTPVAKELW